MIEIITLNKGILVNDIDLKKIKLLLIFFHLC